jgi:hypothetical protein
MMPFSRASELAHAGDAREQVAAGLGVGEAEQAVADLDGEDVDVDELADVLGPAAAVAGGGGRGPRPCLAGGLALGRRAAAAAPWAAWPARRCALP